jgi:peptidoglycan/LPS O-acetylase OafA/YrhL
MTCMATRTYRPDVDGLRGVAIVLVLLFHGTKICPGGFIGVDVFFTISGFLITSLLLDDQQRGGGIRVVDFWIRRVRRLLPAASLMVLATLIAGFFIMFPNDYEALAKSAAAQQLFVSNVYFGRQSGYFDSSVEFKPLLHTWSLAVEEQFYVAYPLLFLALGRLSRRTMVGALLLITGFSFGISDWAVRTHPSSAFYLLPSRAWEILLGGLLCFAPLPHRRPALFANLLAGIGMLGILLAAWAFGKETPFPGRAALLPCVGTALLIYANSWTKTWVGRVLATRPVVFVGLISYSLYLWHWPLLSFLAYLRCGAPSNEISRCIALAASFVLAVVSWRFVELPFRRKDFLPRTKGLLIAAFVGVSVLLVSSLAIVRLRGLPERISPQADAYARAKERDRGSPAWQLLFKKVPLEQIIDGTLPTFGATSGDATCLVWGDSHAMALIPGIDAASKTRGVRGFQATYSATPPLLDFQLMTQHGLSERVIAFNRATVDFAVAKRVDIIFISGRWMFYARRPNFAACLGRTIEELSDAGIHVVLVRDVADFSRRANPTRELAMAVQLGKDVTRVGMPLADHLRVNDRCNVLFDRFASNHVSVFDPAPAFVDETGLWRAEYGGESMYIDDHHLSITGSLRLQPLFEALFDRLLPPAEQPEDAP